MKVTLIITLIDCLKIVVIGLIGRGIKLLYYKFRPPNIKKIKDILDLINYPKHFVTKRNIKKII